MDPRSQKNLNDALAFFKAQSEEKEKQEEIARNEYDRVYGGFLKPKIPANATVDDIEKSGCVVAIKAMKAVEKLHISLDEDFLETPSDKKPKGLR